MKVMFGLRVPLKPLTMEDITRKVAAQIAAEEDKRFLALLMKESKKKK